MRLLASSVLFFEAVVIGLAIPATLALGTDHRGLVVWGGLGLVLCCLLALALMRSPVGYVLGSLVQVAAVAAGFLLPAMFFLGGLFALLWVLALRLPARAARIQAALPPRPPG